MGSANGNRQTAEAIGAAYEAEAKAEIGAATCGALSDDRIETQNFSALSLLEELLLGAALN